MKKLIACFITLSLVLALIPTIYSGHIVIVQGYSSGGKTSILKELSLKVLEKPVKMIYWDDYIRIKIKENAVKFGYNLNDDSWWNHFSIITSHLTPDEKLEFSNQIFEGFCEPIKKLAQKGYTVFVDTVDKSRLPIFLEKMEGIKITFVFVYTPLSKVINFMESRNNKAESHLDRRSLLISLIQYKNVLKPAENDEIIVDILEIEEIKRSFGYMNNESFWYLDKPDNFEQNFLKHFKLDSLSSVHITPILYTDMILYHSDLPAAERAEILKNMLKL